MPTALLDGYRFEASIAHRAVAGTFARSGTARPLSRPTHDEHHHHVRASAAASEAMRVIQFPDEFLVGNAVELPAGIGEVLCGQACIEPAGEADQLRRSVAV